MVQRLLHKCLGADGMALWHRRKVQNSEETKKKDDAEVPQIGIGDDSSYGKEFWGRHHGDEFSTAMLAQLHHK